jgi:hypothetical protein
MRISFHSTGDFKKTEHFLQKMKKFRLEKHLNKAGQQGVQALRNATPKESGLAAASWNYRIEAGSGSASIVWYNTNVENGFQVAIRLQYGYATGTGGYVAGRDYINPAMKPIFDRIADEVWKEVVSA